jgi:hypothetical protein
VTHTRVCVCVCVCVCVRADCCLAVRPCTLPGIYRHSATVLAIFSCMYTVIWLRGFLTLTEVFPCFFLSCKTNARVKLAKTGHGPHSSTLVVICVVRLLFVLFCVLFVCKCVLPPGDDPIAVNPLNAELNPICHLLIFLGDLTFMGPCIVGIF